MRLFRQGAAKQKFKKVQINLYIYIEYSNFLGNKQNLYKTYVQNTKSSSQVQRDLLLVFCVADI